MKLARLLAAALVVVLLIGALLWSQFRPPRLRVSGFVESHEIRVGSRVGGRVAEILIEEGDAVHAGDPLLKLEPYDLLQRRSEAAAMTLQRKESLNKLKAGFRPEEVAEAKAQVEQMHAELSKLVAGPRKQEIDAAKARLRLAQAETDRAHLQYQRIEPLLRSGAASQEQFDDVDKQLKVANAQLVVAQDDLALLEEGSREEDIAAARARLAEAEAAYQLRTNGYREEEIAEAAAALDAAQADLDVIDRQIEELTVKAPVDGVIEASDLRPGDLLSANAPAISLTNPQELWVRAYVPENHLNLRIGQELPVTVDSFPDREFIGRISFIARQAEFTPGNVQTPEERSKQVFRIKVLLTTGLDVLRPGMSADVWLDGRRSGK